MILSLRVNTVFLTRLAKLKIPMKIKMAEFCFASLATNYDSSMVRTFIHEKLIFFSPRKQRLLLFSFFSFSFTFFYHFHLSS